MLFSTARAGARLSRVAIIGTAALACSTCARVPSQSASMQASPEVIVSAHQLQLQSFEIGRNLSTLIERAADSIKAVSAEPAVRRNALLWKISAIPLVQEAALRNSPDVALADLMAFTLQQRDYLTIGSGRNSFGSQQPIAVAAAGEAEQMVIRGAARALRSGKLSVPAEARLREWAAGHPMQGPALRRTSILDSDWEALGISDNSLAATIGDVNRTVMNLSYRMSYLNETLAAEVRWNAELVAEQALRTPRVDSLFGTGTASLRSVGALAEDAPALLDRQREAMMVDVDRERVAMMRDIDGQRVLAFQDLAVQRVAFEAALAAELKAVMERVGQERTAVMLSADSITRRSIDHSVAMLRRLAWEGTLLALIIVAALLGSALLLIKRWRATAA